MIYGLDFLQRCVDWADRLVFGKAPLTKTVIDARTLVCFILFIVCLFSGFAVVSFLNSKVAEFVVWTMTSVPLALIFFARHQRLKDFR